jgi:inosine-uridine nucleoside N-ribohydrolase
VDGQADRIRSAMRLIIDTDTAGDDVFSLMLALAALA